MCFEGFVDVTLAIWEHNTHSVKKSRINNRKNNTTEWKLEERYTIEFIPCGGWKLKLKKSFIDLLLSSRSQHRQWPTLNPLHPLPLATQQQREGDEYERIIIRFYHFLQNGGINRPNGELARRGFSVGQIAGWEHEDNHNTREEYTSFTTKQITDNSFNNLINHRFPLKPIFILIWLMEIT